jgi:hypothetical protein
LFCVPHLWGVLLFSFSPPTPSISPPPAPPLAPSSRPTLAKKITKGLNFIPHPRSSVNIDVPAAQVKRARLMLPLHGSLSALHFSGVFFPSPDNFSGLDMAAIETKFFGFFRFPAWHAHCLSLIASRRANRS